LSLTNQDIAINLDNCLPKMDLERIFFRPAPLHLEIGSGKGTFLLNQARAHPHLNFLGLEWANKYYRYSVDRMRRWGITNVRLLRADAREVIGRLLPDKAVTAFHIYFPDPWPKKRHHKRRLFNPSNVEHLLRCLQNEGELRVATDHAPYFEIICHVLHDTRIAPRLEKIDFLPLDAADEGEWVGSNFERKYLKEGRKVFTLALRKRAPV